MTIPPITFPTELLVQIFSGVDDLKSLNHIRLVCKNWLDILNSMTVRNFCRAAWPPRMTNITLKNMLWKKFIKQEIHPFPSFSTSIPLLPLSQESPLNHFFSSSSLLKDMQDLIGEDFEVKHDPNDFPGSELTGIVVTKNNAYLLEVENQTFSLQVYVQNAENFDYLQTLNKKTIYTNSKRALLNYDEKQLDFPNLQKIYELGNNYFLVKYTPHNSFVYTWEIVCLNIEVDHVDKKLKHDDHLACTHDILQVFFDDWNNPIALRCHDHKKGMHIKWLREELPLDHLTNVQQLWLCATNLIVKRHVDSEVILEIYEIPTLSTPRSTFNCTEETLICCQQGLLFIEDKVNSSENIITLHIYDLTKAEPSLVFKFELNWDERWWLMENYLLIIRNACLQVYDFRSIFLNGSGVSVHYPYYELLNLSETELVTLGSWMVKDRFIQLALKHAATTKMVYLVFEKDENVSNVDMGAESEVEEEFTKKRKRQ